MDGLHLILHKVRGEPAIDVAQRIAIGDKWVWLIPTSGHRAHPLRWQALDCSLADGLADERSADTIEGKAWAALHDHYAPKQRKGILAQLRARVAAAIA